MVRLAIFSLTLSTILIACFPFLSGQVTTVLDSVSPDPLIFKLLKRVQAAQWKKNQSYLPEFTYPPLKWTQQSGLYAR